MLAFSPLSVRYLSPYTEHLRGGTGSYVVDAAIERVERHADGYRIRASGTTWEGELELESDEVIAATGFRAPVRDLPSVGVAMVNDGRHAGTDTVLGECLGPRDLLRGERDARLLPDCASTVRRAALDPSTGSATTLASSRSTSPRSTSESRPERRPLDRDEVVPYLLR